MRPAALRIPALLVAALGLCAGAMAAPPAEEIEAAAAAAAAAAPAEGAERIRSLFDMGWDSDKPISIRSDELEYVRSEGERRLVFRREVNVEQDGLTIRSSRLEAFYPAEGSQPERLVAEGEVLLAKGDRSVRCQRVVYERRRELLTCEGGAELQQGKNRLSGDVIEIDLGADRVRVRGGAAVTLEDAARKGP